MEDVQTMEGVGGGEGKPKKGFLAERFLEPGASSPYKAFNSYPVDLREDRAPDRKNSRLSINYFLLHERNWEEAGFKTGTCGECFPESNLDSRHGIIPRQCRGIL